MKRSAPRILVILGHPRGTSSLAGAIAASYAEGARAQPAAQVRVFDLSAARFDPDVHTESPSDQALEPDLESLRADIEWADHLAFVFPTWWGTMPALLKAMLDRVLVPGWAFGTTDGGSGYEGRLHGRTAELITPMDTPAAVYRLLHGAPGFRALARATLGFCVSRFVAPPASGRSGAAAQRNAHSGCRCRRRARSTISPPPHGREPRRLDRAQRIDAPLAASLSYILWFVLLPMLALP